MTASAGPALKQFYAEVGDRVAFVTLYVREAHPGERFPQPETFEQKLHHARLYKERDDIPWPVAVDSLEGDLHRALGSKPNSAYLMNRDGRVAFRVLWSNDEESLREGLEALVSQAQARPWESTRKLLPMLRGMGRMDDILKTAGRQAMQDVRREVPPLYGLARLAGRFRRLPPLGRGVAATATVFVGLAVIVGGLGWLLTRRRTG